MKALVLQPFKDRFIFYAVEGFFIIEGGKTKWLLVSIVLQLIDYL